MSDAPVIVKVKRDNDAVSLPEYKTTGSAGCDVRSLEYRALLPGGRYLFHTGLRLEVPSGYECQIRSRSGLALNDGVVIAQGVGTLDSDFRGELCVLLINHGDIPVQILKGDRIAQLIFAKVEQAEFVVTDELGDTDRGEGGWGSSGKR